MAKRTRYRAGSSAGAVPQTQRAPNVPNPAFANSSPAMTPDIPTPKSRSTKFTRPVPPAFTADVSKTQEHLRLSNTMKNTQINEAPSFDWGIIRSAEGAKVPPAVVGAVDDVIKNVSNAPTPQTRSVTEVVESAGTVPPPVSPGSGNFIAAGANFISQHRKQVAVGVGGGATAVGVGSALSQVADLQREANELEAEEQAKFDAQNAENEQYPAPQGGTYSDPFGGFGTAEAQQESYVSALEEQVRVSAPSYADAGNFDPVRGYKQQIGTRDDGTPIIQYLSGGGAHKLKNLGKVLEEQKNRNVIGTKDDGTKIYQKDKVAEMFYNPTLAYEMAGKNQKREDEFGNTVAPSNIMRPEGWKDIAKYGTDPKQSTGKSGYPLYDIDFGNIGSAGTPNIQTSPKFDFSSPFTTPSGQKGKNAPKLPWEI